MISVIIYKCSIYEIISDFIADFGNVVNNKCGNLFISHFRTNYNRIIMKFKIERRKLVYKKFHELLLKTNKTAYRVSKDTGIRANTFTDWKNGRSKPKVEKLKILSEYFDVPIEFFLEE